MSKILSVFLVFMLSVSCIGRYKSDAEKVVVNLEPVISTTLEADTLRVNIAKSKIDWVATEMRGMIRRTGKISFKDGFLLIADKEIIGGRFTVDMETMEVTDIPLHERIARKNLIDHLKSDDFFNIALFPESVLVITNIEKSDNGNLRISGNLSIRDITKNIEFLAILGRESITTRFTFNRLDWGIEYEGSWAAKTLIDKDVELKVEIDLSE